MFHDVILKFK